MLLVCPPNHSHKYLGLVPVLLWTEIGGLINLGSQDRLCVA